MMERLMRKWFVAIVLLAPVFFSMGSAVDVRAQEEIRLEALEVALWPEFDQPATLVIYHILVAPEAEFPAQLAFRIPVEAGEPNAVAAQNAAGALVDVPYTRSEDGEWAWIAFESRGAFAQLEYYDALAIEGGARAYEFVWPGDYAVNNFLVQVQQPFAVEDLVTTPAIADSHQGEDGLTYYETSFESRASGEVVEISVAYTNPSGELSSLHVDPNAGGGAANISLIALALGIAGVVLVSYSAWRYFSGSVRAEAKKLGKSEMQVQAEKEGPVYCLQCATEALPGDQFCRNCGKKLPKLRVR
jgi:hypothetical protein